MNQTLTDAPAFLVLPAYIFADKRLSIQDKIIWAGVVGITGDDEQAWEDHPLLQRLIKDDIPVVRKCLDHLVELGLLLSEAEGVQNHYFPKSNAMMWHPVEL